ncbi:LysR family transcriptional regulator [Neisseria dentiae]|uniref:LysR family transcriptional regulator n=1 Tax=Neisseria dentiae TaxID=194197 RepID=UPI0035A052E1
MDKLTAIKVFLSVAETGSFTAAADRLDMSKPMITRHIALMEDWLNARLFQRTTRQVRLTDAGEQALVFCQKNVGLKRRNGTGIGCAARRFARQYPFEQQRFVWRGAFDASGKCVFARTSEFKHSFGIKRQIAGFGCRAH